MSPSPFEELLNVDEADVSINSQQNMSFGDVSMNSQMSFDDDQSEVERLRAELAAMKLALAEERKKNEKVIFHLLKM